MTFQTNSFISSCTLCLLMAGSILLFACRKTGFITSPDARIVLTVDTLKFDTVFTTAGSVTQSFKIINDNDQKLRLSSIRLMGGNNSVYRINIDGAAVSESANLELEGKDSMYIFVQVTVDPSAANLPFIIRDSIRIAFNGKEEFVQLESWGQNAHFFRNKSITGNETWTNDLPYVIQGFLYVDQDASLNIEKGCRIFVNANAPVIISGSLKVNGGKDTADRVYFPGDRMDQPYRNFPASWPGIYFTEVSADNILQYAVIKNAYQAIIIEAPASNGNPKLSLNECVIDNAFDAGILANNSSLSAQNCLISNCGKNISIAGGGAYQFTHFTVSAYSDLNAFDAGILANNSSLSAQNCLISNCGKNISIAGGGAYQFTHCTVAAYSNNYIDHKNPVLSISNSNGSGTAALQALFRNCIFWGEGGLVENEVVVERAGATPFNVNFDYNLWKVIADPANATITQVIDGQTPLFDSVNVSDQYYNFRLMTGSPAIGKGVASSVSIDLDGRARSVNQPDLGCFEHN